MWGEMVYIYAHIYILSPHTYVTTQTHTCNHTIMYGVYIVYLTELHLHAETNFAWTTLVTPRWTFVSRVCMVQGGGERAGSHTHAQNSPFPVYLPPRGPNVTKIWETMFFGP